MTSTTPETIPARLPAPVRAAETPDRWQTHGVEVVDYQPSLVETLRELWRARRVLPQVFFSALQSYLKRYRLGPFWIIFQTFMAIVGYSLIFGGVFNVQAPNGMPYFLYMMVGMMGFQLFQRTMSVSSRSFQRLKTLVRDLHIPLIMVPLAGAAQALIQFSLYLVAYLISIVYYLAAKGHLYAQLGPKYLLMSFAGLALCLVFAWGISLWTAPLTAHTRDVRMILKFATPFWMLVTPVMYPIDRLHGKTRLVAELNPLTSPVEMAKVGLTGTGSVRLAAALWSIGLISVVFVSGVWFMNRFGMRVVGLQAGLDDDDDDDAML